MPTRTPPTHTEIVQALGLDAGDHLISWADAVTAVRVHHTTTKMRAEDWLCAAVEDPDTDLSMTWVRGENGSIYGVSTTRNPATGVWGHEPFKAAGYADHGMGWTHVGVDGRYAGRGGGQYVPDGKALPYLGTRAAFQHLLDAMHEEHQASMVGFAVDQMTETAAFDRLFPDVQPTLNGLLHAAGVTKRRSGLTDMRVHTMERTRKTGTTIEPHVTLDLWGPDVALVVGLLGRLGITPQESPGA